MPGQRLSGSLLTRPFVVVTKMRHQEGVGGVSRARVVSERAEDAGRRRGGGCTAQLQRRRRALLSHDPLHQVGGTPSSTRQGRRSGAGRESGRRPDTGDVPCGGRFRGETAGGVARPPCRSTLQTRSPVAGEAQGVLTPAGWRIWPRRGSRPDRVGCCRVA
jgi:hypothetical protein